MLDDPERQLLPLGRYFSQRRSPSQRAGRPLPQSPPEQTSLAQPVFLPSREYVPSDGSINRFGLAETLGRPPVRVGFTGSKCRSIGAIACAPDADSAWH